MKPKFLALIALCVVCAVPDVASAQLFRWLPRNQNHAAPATGNCPNGQCQTAPPIIATPPADQPPIYSRPAVVAPPIDYKSTVRVPCETLTLELHPLDASEDYDLTGESITEAAAGGDRFTTVIEATCRVTVSGTCGSGTVVGRDSDGRALVLTNAHVAGTRKGRQVKLVRWNVDGSSETGTAEIIASGYGRGMSIDFALVRASAGFAADVTPIPIADRYPDQASGVTTYGCPRCEWPSMQVLRLTRDEGQVLRWHPQAIGGRSGSSVVDYVDGRPRVVGLLTWGGGGEGMGQSTPFLLSAMRGQLPKAFEALPSNAIEVATQDDIDTPAQAVCKPDGTLPEFRTSGGVRLAITSPLQYDDDVEPVGILDDITDGDGEPPREPDADPDTPDGCDENGILDRIIDRRKPDNDNDGCGLLPGRTPSIWQRITAFVRTVAWAFVALLVGLVAGFVIGRRRV